MIYFVPIATYNQIKDMYRQLQLSSKPDCFQIAMPTTLTEPTFLDIKFPLANSMRKILRDQKQEDTYLELIF